jgi:hypothetical protein
MRSFPSLSRSALVAAAAAVLLTACGGADGSGSEETAESTSADTSSSAAPSTGSSSAGSSSAGSSDPAVAAFCQETGALAPLATQLGTAPPAEVPDLLRQAVTSFQGITPPAEIATDYQTVTDLLAEASRIADSVDLNSPEGQQQVIGALSGAAPAQQRLTAWTETNCPSPAPTT